MREEQSRRTSVCYSEVRDKIADGDLLLYRRRGLISIAGRGAAKAAW